MERVTLILNISLTLLVATAGAVFALAEGRTGIPAITIPVAIAACLLVDQYRLWRLPNSVQNLLGLAAFAAAGVELYLSDIEAPLLAGGHLLSYLTCAFLLQPKGRRQFWWLAALSLLQVAVASVLTYDSWFGLVMPLFLLELLWTMSVFQLQQAALTFDATVAGQLPIALSPGPSPGLARSSASRSAQLDEQHRWVTPRFVLSTLTGTVLSLLLAVSFFVFIPRVWPNTNPVFTDGGRMIGGAPSRSGYTTRVTLGHVGEIQESARVALESRMFNPETKAPIEWSEWLALLGGGPRFRGVTQEVYDAGSWDRWEGIERNGELDLDELPVALGGGFRQHTLINHESVRGQSDVAMTCGLPLSGSCNDPRRQVGLEPFSWSLASGRRSRGANRSVHYEFDVVPVDPWFPNWIGQIGASHTWRSRSSRSYLTTTLQLDPELKDALEQWIAEHPALHVSSMSHSAIAQQYERWFLGGTELTYSLNLSIVDPQVDPVIDFLRNTRRGHCEYFATALALLLRTQGIPARVVTGFKGGQVGTDGVLTVRDLHAHLWVEAYLADAPANPRTGQSGPRWITLDPTPAARNSVVAAQEELAASAWGRLQTGWLMLWSTSIRMSEADQRALIFDPLRDIAVSTWGDVRGALSGRGSRFSRFLTSPRDWFSWQGGLFVFFVLSAGLALYRGVRALRLRWRRSTRAAAVTGPQAMVVPFYRRFESLLAEHGLTRPASRTPREFVDRQTDHLQARVPEQLAALPADLTETFYSVRYGHNAMSDEESQTMESKLNELERELGVDALRRSRSGPPPAR